MASSTTPIREFGESLGFETQIGARILDEIRIPTYDPDAESHQKLAQLSKDLHSGDQILTDGVEEERDDLVREAIGTLEEQQTVQATFDQVTRGKDELFDDILGEFSSRSAAAQTIQGIFTDKLTQYLKPFQLRRKLYRKPGRDAFKYAVRTTL